MYDEEFEREIKEDYHRMKQRQRKQAKFKLGCLAVMGALVLLMLIIFIVAASNAMKILGV